MLEEKAHVAVGAVWFGRVCEALGTPAPTAFRSLLATLCPDLLKVRANLIGGLT